MGLKTIALIAHDNKKQELVDWALSNIETLKKYDLCGTGHTATLVEDATKLLVKKFLSGARQKVFVGTARRGSADRCASGGRKNRFGHLLLGSAADAAA